jgi:hypothetical protein
MGQPQGWPSAVNPGNAIREIPVLAAVPAHFHLPWPGDLV